MVDVPYNTDKIQIEGCQYRSPVSEAILQQIAGGINFLLDRQINVVEFTSSGTWTPPYPGIKYLLHAGFGGGGGGSAGAYPFDYGGSFWKGPGGAGGNGAPLNFGLLSGISYGDILNIVIGTGGAGGVYSAKQGGADGADSLITRLGSTLFRFPGGGGGNYAEYPETRAAVSKSNFKMRGNGAYGGHGSTTDAVPGETATVNFLYAEDGQPHIGLGGIKGANIYSGGGGGGGGVGNGGNGGFYLPVKTPGGNGGIAAGGGGGGGADGSIAATPTSGGSGGPGKVWLYYF